MTSRRRSGCFGRRHLHSWHLRNRKSTSWDILNLKTHQRSQSKWSIHRSWSYPIESSYNEDWKDEQIQLHSPPPCLICLWRVTEIDPILLWSFRIPCSPSISILWRRLEVQLWYGESLCFLLLDLLLSHLSPVLFSFSICIISHKSSQIIEIIHFLLCSCSLPKSSISYDSYYTETWKACFVQWEWNCNE